MDVFMYMCLAHFALYYIVADDVFVKYGNNMTLQCSLLGTSFHWNKNGNIHLSNNEKYSGTSTAFLTVINTDLNDSGIFRCTAFTSSGKWRQGLAYKLNIILNGNWSQWSAWSECSRTCGGGLWTRRRSCTDPSPLNGGSDCSGLRFNTRICSMSSCPGFEELSTESEFEEDVKHTNILSTENTGIEEESTRNEFQTDMQFNRTFSNVTTGYEEVSTNSEFDTGMDSKRTFTNVTIGRTVVGITIVIIVLMIGSLTILCNKYHKQRMSLIRQKQKHLFPPRSSDNTELKHLNEYNNHHAIPTVPTENISLDDNNSNTVIKNNDISNQKSGLRRQKETKTSTFSQNNIIQENDVLSEHRKSQLSSHVYLSINPRYDYIDSDKDLSSNVPLVHADYSYDDLLERRQYTYSPLNQSINSGNIDGNLLYEPIDYDYIDGKS
ncbi:unnamed protein product [Mytilus coruscus]|uniref:Ig-like domain-containing protein n=1 Tax=Mytilus coruscus TaxID=42192 RepID=A0A6J8C6D9_MYTCO|nr:unnamed protein product [Mytilus coruscus]